MARKRRTGACDIWLAPCKPKMYQLASNPGRTQHLTNKQTRRFGTKATRARERLRRTAESSHRREQRQIVACAEVSAVKGHAGNPGGVASWLEISKWLGPVRRKLESGGDGHGMKWANFSRTDLRLQLVNWDISGEATQPHPRSWVCGDHDQ